VVAIDAPVTVFGLRVHPGDLVHATATARW
jgi:regulator of RNase E activity RraA